MKQEYRPCPICKGIKPEDCSCCKGRGQFPYPWVLPEDKTIPVRWSTEETAIIYGALTATDAYSRYVFVYGVTERTHSSVYRHWQYIHHSKSVYHQWSNAETTLVVACDTLKRAVSVYFAEYGDLRSPEAVRMKWGRVHFQNHNPVLSAV